jgi:hypothetical protein
MEAKKKYFNMFEHFHCEKCDYECSTKGSWKQHLLTAKHHKANKMLKNANKIFFCENCKTSFKHQSSLCRHKKKCFNKDYDNEVQDKNDLDISNKDALIIQLLQQNSELQKSLIEMSKEKSINNSNNTNNINNSHNKTFNLQFFLNETCKDALNITDFVSSIKPTLEQLEYTGRQGYIAGVSNIIINKLNTLKECIRPIHCCDHKREILYVKDNDRWEKEDNEKPIITNAIKMIANENIKNIKDWRDAHPNCTDSDSQKNNLYLKIVSNSMCGLDKEETNKNMNKIISNIAKEVIIDKNI